MNKVAGLFIVLFAASIFKSCENIQKFDPQCFRNISNNIHDVLSKIFGALQLPEQLQETDRFGLLWIMHNNLNSMAQNYFKIYIDTVNASKVDNKAVNSLSTLNNVIEEMAQEENIITIYNSTDAYNLTGYVASHEASNIFISDFTNKFDNFTMTYILNKALNVGSYKTQQKIIKSRRRIGYKRRRRNLKLWRPPTSSEEDNDNLTRRMTPAEDPVITQFPFIVSIHALDEFICAGAILSNLAVITAGSCLHVVYQNENILHDDESLKVRAGTEYPNKFGLTVSAAKVNFHPFYNPMTLDNNLAIVKLKWSLNFKWKIKNIKRVSYGKIENALQRNLHEVIMIGWGDKDSVPQVDHLSVTKMDIIELKKCRSIYTEKYVSSKNFCGAILKRNPQTPCQRDIGSPAVIGNLLVGVVSYGPSVCSPPSAPTVYTDLSTYAKWINETIADNSVSVTRSLANSETTSSSVKTAAPSAKPAAPGAHFRQSSNLGKQQSVSNLRAKNIITPLENTYPETVKFLSFLLKEIVGSNINVEETKELKKETKEEFKDKSLEVIYTSEEYDDVYRRPEKNDGDGDFDDSELRTTTIKDVVKGLRMIKSTRFDYSEEIEPDVHYLTHHEGLSISVESVKKTSSSTRSKILTPRPASRHLKSPKSSDTKNKKNNQNEYSNLRATAKKKIKNFKDLQQMLGKEVREKQEERILLRHQNELKESQQTKQAKEESEEEEIIKMEIEKIIEEVKNKRKKKPSEPTSSLVEDDKKTFIRKLIEEILNKQEKIKAAQHQVSKRKPIEPNLYYDEEEEEEPFDENEETEEENYITTTVRSHNTPNPKAKTWSEHSKEIAKNMKKTGKNKQSYEIERQVKKKVKQTLHKQTSAKQKDIEYRSTKLVPEAILDKNFIIDGKVSKKGKKPKTTTPHMLIVTKSKIPKTSRIRALDVSTGGKSVTKRMKLENEHKSTESVDSFGNDESISSKERFYSYPQELKKPKVTTSILSVDSDDESPMFLPPAMVDFQLATKDRLVTKFDPYLSAMNAELIFDEDTSINNEDKLATRGVMTIDDLNIQLEIPEEWAFRRQLSPADSSLEAYVKAGKKT